MDKTNCCSSQQASCCAPQEIGPFEQYEPSYRQHHCTTYAANGPYERYRAAYLHGYQIACHPQHQGKRWPEVEPHAKREWEVQHPGSWEAYKDAVEEGWERIGMSV